VYFCCTEALHNAFKHGGAGIHIRLSLEGVGSELTFEVADDGRGFEPSNRRRGVGFDNMTDRLGSVAGRLEVNSSVGEGTRVRGVVPVGHPADAPARVPHPPVMIAIA
jgi:signal transduction histidine kinase